MCHEMGDLQIKVYFILTGKWNRELDERERYWYMNWLDGMNVDFINF